MRCEQSSSKAGVMMEIKNSLTGGKERFPMAKGRKVGMYVCGITPYDSSHLGHARTLVSFDIARRYLLYRGCKVTYVQNITDIDDKIIRRAKERGEMPLSLSLRFAEKSAREFAALGIMEPDFSPKVSERIGDIVKLIGKIEKRGFAYRTDSGVYFDVMKFKGYGRLSRQDMAEIKVGARVEVDEKKKNPQDFALWKFGEEEGATFDSPWGRGRPGWHIECSAMACALLGDTIDIHGGARDLVFPHHENEIAQSEAATGKPFAKFFMHTGFLTVNKEKMSKSLGNFITIEDGLKKHSPQAIRLFFCLTHYASPIDYSDDAASAAGNSLATLQSAVLAARGYSSKAAKGKGIAKAADDAERAFRKAMDDDFDTPSALAALFALAKRLLGACGEGSEPDAEVKGAGERLDSLLAVLGLEVRQEGNAAKESDCEEKVRRVCADFSVEAHGGLESLVLALISAREDARKRKDYAASDAIRKRLSEAGIVLEDRKDGSTGWRLAG